MSTESKPANAELTWFVMSTESKPANAKTTITTYCSWLFPLAWGTHSFPLIFPFLVAWWQNLNITLKDISIVQAAESKKKKQLSLLAYKTKPGDVTFTYFTYRWHLNNLLIYWRKNRWYPSSPNPTILYSRVWCIFKSRVYSIYRSNLSSMKGSVLKESQYNVRGLSDSVTLSLDCFFINHCCWQRKHCISHDLMHTQHSHKCMK